jgi:hypothetical protein
MIQEIVARRDLREHPLDVLALGVDQHAGKVRGR